MSRLYEALTALERKRADTTTPRVPHVSAPAPSRRYWPAITAALVAISGAMALVVIPRSRPAAAPTPTPMAAAPSTQASRAPQLRDRAREAALLGLLDESEALLQQAVKATPSDAVAWNDLGVVLVRRGQLPRAIEALKHSVAADPRYGTAQRNLAVALDRSGDAAQALSHYRAFVELSPDDPDRARVVERLARAR